MAAKEPALFLVLSIQNLIKVDEVLYGKLKEKDIISKIKEAIEKHKKEIIDEDDLAALNRQYNGEEAFT